MHKTKKRNKIIINSILTFLSIVWAFPILFTVFNSFKGKAEYNLGNFWDFPQGNELFENIKYIKENADLFSGMANSLIYALAGAFFAVVIALLAAYAISLLEIKHRMFWFIFIYSGTIFPFQIYLIPIYRGYSSLGLYNTKLGMVLFYTAICIPFCMFVLRNFFIGISKEIMESARIDGATDMQILMHLLLPMAIAPVSVVFLTQFSWSWNDLMFGLTFTKSTSVRTVMATLSLMGNNHQPAQLLACIIASLPTLLLFSILQKNFETGFVYTTK